MAAPSVENVLIHVFPNFGIDSLKTEQKLILECLVSKQNCVAVLPTGFGKLLPFLFGITHIGFSFIYLLII